MVLKGIDGLSMDSISSRAPITDGLRIKVHQGNLVSLEYDP